MNPLRLTAENYRSFADLDITFPEGCTAILGVNGAGKSSIVGAIDLCLFGSRNLLDYLTEGIDAPMVLALEFEHRGELYRVRRSYSPKGRGQTKVDFERLADFALYGDPIEQWLPYSRETAAATQTLIGQTLGLSRETFRASAFLAQGDGAAFTEAQPRERKAILAEVLGLEVWDRLLAKARTDKAVLESEVGILGRDIARSREQLVERSALEGQRADLGKRAEQAQDEVAKLEARKAEIAGAIVTKREAAAALSAARETVAAREAELARIHERALAIRTELAHIEREEAVLAEFSARADTLPDLEREQAEAVAAAQARHEYERAQAERGRLRARGFALWEKAAALEGSHGESCDRCGQPLHEEARQRAIASYTAEADDLREQAHRIVLPEVPKEVRDQEDVRQEIGLARAAVTRVAGIRAGLERKGDLLVEQNQLGGAHTEAAAAANAAKAELARLDQGKGDLTALEDDLRKIETLVAYQRTVMGEAREQLAVIEAKLEDLGNLTVQVEAWEDERERKQAELDIVLLAERAYGRDGIPALIVENAAIPQIELEANRILAELGTSFTVELHTQRALKSSEGLKESLDIVVAGPIGARPYETFSGGERTRLNLALRIALARLLANRRGADVRMLAIDEPEFLDEAGVARLAEVLRGLSTDFDRVLLVSHVPGLRDAFDQVIEVEKEGDRSRVVGAPEREAVAA